MKCAVIMTHYHLLHCIALSMHIKEKFDLYISVEYSEMTDDFIKKIESTNFFNSIYKIEQKSFIFKFKEELKKAYTNYCNGTSIDKIGDSIFEKYLVDYYKNIFKNADYNDYIFLYNDHNLYYYYISKHFNAIIGVEDGYKQLERKMLQDEPKDGYFQWLEPFIGKYFPQMHWKNNNVKKIISSCNISKKLCEIKERVYIVDFFDMVKENEHTFRDVTNEIYEFDQKCIKEFNSIYLTQPLNRSKYCDAIDMFLLDRKIIMEYSPNKLVIKPHPANRFDFKIFENHNIKCINKNIPIELIDFNSTNIKECVSFISSGLESIRGIDKVVRICDNRATRYEEIKKEIDNFISDEKIYINVYLKCSNLSIENYLNAYSFNFENERLIITTYVLVEKEIYSDALNFFSIKNYKCMMKKYKSMNRKKYVERGYRNHKSIKKLFKMNSIKCRHVTSLCDSSITEEDFIKDNKSDFFIILDIKNNGFQFVNEIEGVLSKEIKFAYFFNEISYVGNKKMYLGVNSAYQILNLDYSGILWHKSMLGMEARDLYRMVLNSKVNVKIANNINIYKSFTNYNIDGELLPIQGFDNSLENKNQKNNYDYVSMLEWWTKIIKVNNGKPSLYELSDNLKKLVLKDDVREKIYIEFLDRLMNYLDGEQRRYFYRQQSFFYRIYLILKKVKVCIHKWKYF